MNNARRHVSGSPLIHLEAFQLTSKLRLMNDDELSGCLCFSLLKEQLKSATMIKSTDQASSFARPGGGFLNWPSVKARPAGPSAARTLR